MYGLIVMFLTLLFGGAFAHSDLHVELGDEAKSIQESGETHHKSLSVIRKMHPEILNHKRDKTSRQGVRTKENSLKGCVHCHSSKDTETGQYYPINTQDQFCATCHQKVSVSVDCFGCHRTTPQEDLL